MCPEDIKTDKKKKKKNAQGVFYVVIQKLMNQKFFLRKQ